MEIIQKRLAGLFEVIPEKNTDERGFFLRLFDEKIFKELNLPDISRVQESCIFTKERFTLRGLHISLPPHLEAKTVTAIRGITLWVAVDVRKGSETFGQWTAIELNGDLCNTMVASRGFAHGCISRTDDCCLISTADNEFSEQHGVRINWDDPDLGIDWKNFNTKPILRTDYPEPFMSFAEFVRIYGGVEIE